LDLGASRESNSFKEPEKPAKFSGYRKIQSAPAADLPWRRAGTAFDPIANLFVTPASGFFFRQQS
jgi:hypothetical protein